MAERRLVRLEDIASHECLCWAFWRAARGKRYRPEAMAFAANLEPELASLRHRILALEVPLGPLRAFQIRDPKLRTIHAPAFRDRVFHHALMAHVGPALEKALVPETFACRVGKGTLAAVLRAQTNSRRHPWWAKMDIRSYFASIDHEILKGLLARRFKGKGALSLCERVIHSFESSPGKGLPIGALTSQHFANLYLAPLDRFLLERLRLPAMVRYMDDVVWWSKDRAVAHDALLASTEFVATNLRLAVKRVWEPQRSERGLAFCGFRVLPSCLRLSRRRRVRYRRVRSTWEASHALGLIDDLALQAGYASALAITAHAQAAAWRRRQLANWPAPEV